MYVDGFRGGAVEMRQELVVVVVDVRGLLVDGCHGVSCLVVMLSDRYARYLPPTQLCLFSFVLLVSARLVSLPPPLHTRTRNPRPPSLRLFYVVGLSYRCCCWLSRGQFRHFALRPSRNG